MSPQSSVKINQISLDESGEHVGICSEDGKVRSLCSSPLVTDPQACRKKKNVNLFLIFIIQPKICIKLILSGLNFMLMMWNLRCFVVHFYLHSQSINLKLYLYRICTYFLYKSWIYKKRAYFDCVELSVSHQPSMDTLSMFATLLLSCLFSSLPPSFKDFTVKICSLIPPSPHSSHSSGKNKILSHTKKWSTQLKSMLQQLFALNQLSWLLILWKSNLIPNRWCGSQKEIISEFYIIPLLREKKKKKYVFLLLRASEEERLGVVHSNGTLGCVVANWGCGRVSCGGFTESTRPLIGDPAEK